MVEFAIMLPVLVLMFAGAAELGRLFYTYTTLSKATLVGARYLSASRDAQIGGQPQTDAINKGKSVTVCGVVALNCTGQTAVVPGLQTSNVTVTFPVRNGIKYVKVEISGYTYAPKVFNLASLTGKASSAFYFALSPATEERYMK